MSANINGGNWVSGKAAPERLESAWGKTPSPDAPNPPASEFTPSAPISDASEAPQKSAGWVTGPKISPTEQTVIANVPIPEVQPKVTRRIKLKNVSDVKAELARLYRAAVKGEVDVTAASKLTYMLSTQAKLIETSDIERRIAELEAQNGK